MHRTVVRPLLAGLLLLAVAGCSGGAVVDTSVDNSLGFQQGDAKPVVYEAGHRNVADDVSGTTLTGQHLDLRSLRGKIVVVNFWGWWCAPCHEETSGFAAVAREDASKGVAFVGIDERDDSARAEAYEQANHVPYPSIADPNDRLTLAFPGAEPDSTPSTIILDRTGHIAAKINSPLLYTQLKTLVNYFVQEQA